MTKIKTHLLLLVMVFANGSVSEISGDEVKKKNVVVFLVDDLGYKDLGCYGSDYYETPNIDTLAKESLRFTDYYAACAVCTPTRASILTGKYPARLLMTNWLPSGRWDSKKNKLKEGRFLRALPLEEVTLAEALRHEGYKNCFVGKWHLGGEPFYYPRHQGFDVNVAGNDHGNPGSYFHPFKGNWSIPTTGKRVKWQTYAGGKPGDFLTDVLTDEAIGFIEKQKNPFMLYMSYYGVHTPFQSKKEKIAKYKKKAPNKLDRHHVYAGMVESVDDSVGRIVAALKTKGVYDNTMIIFTSDNGGAHWATDHRPLRGNKGCYYEGGIRVPFLLKAAGVKAGTCNEPVISNDIYPTILEALGLKARPHQHMDGLSLMPLTRGGKLKRDSLFWHFPHYNGHPSARPCSVIRKGDWKLIQTYDPVNIELYNLKSDLSEKNNLADTQAAKTKELKAELQQWKKSLGADEMKANPLYGKN
jgi:arylsulfatase A